MWSRLSSKSLLSRGEESGNPIGRHGSKTEALKPTLRRTLRLAYRLGAMSIATKTGDDGNTGLFGGRRVAKDDARIEAYGTVDELNATLGEALSGALPPELRSMLLRIQSDLFDLGAELATPRENNPHAQRVPPFPITALEGVERDLRHLEDQLPPLTAFILPGGHSLSALLHRCRTVCRRAERRVVTLAREERVIGIVLKYLNRLSDLLFVMARTVNLRFSVPEPEWHARDQREPSSGG